MDDIHLFREAIVKAGIPDPMDIIADGKIHRISSNGKRHDQAGWYVLHSDPPMAGAFGCWRTGVWEKWCSNGNTRSDTWWRTLNTKIAEDSEKDLEEQEAKHKGIAKQAEAILEAAVPATDDHPYLQRKAVKAHPGLKAGFWEQRGKRNCLLIPMRDIEGVLWSLQAIYPEKKAGSNRDKDFLAGGKKAGCFFMIGDPGTDKICIAEGYATASSIHEATGLTVAVAFDSGNLIHVTCALRSRYPTDQIIICGDRGNGEDSAREAAVTAGAKIVIPDFTGLNADKGDTDFNDLIRVGGSTFVRYQILKVVEDEKEKPLEETPEEKPIYVLGDEVEPNPYKWRAPGYLCIGEYTLLDGSQGSGKTTVMMALAQAMTLGFGYFNRETHEPLGVVYITREEPVEEIRAHFFGDASKIVFMGSKPRKDGDRVWEEPINIYRDVKDIEAACDALSERVPVGGIFIDNIERHVGDLNSPEAAYKFTTAFRDLLKKFNACGVCSRHINKNTGQSGAARGKGHSAFSGDSVAHYMVGRDREDPDLRHMVVATRIRIHNEKAYPISFNINESRELILLKDKPEMDCDDLVGVGKRDREDPQGDGAREWILTAIDDAGGCLQTHQVKERANAEGRNWTTIERAADRMVDRGELVREKEPLPHSKPRFWWRRP